MYAGNLNLHSQWPGGSVVTDAVVVLALAGSNPQNDAGEWECENNKRLWCLLKARSQCGWLERTYGESTSTQPFFK